MAAVWLLSLAAAIKATTGVALIIVPRAVAGLLLGAELAGVGIAVARVAGIALFSLGLLCWMSRQAPTIPLCSLPCLPTICW